MLYVGNTKYKIHIGNNKYKIATPYDYEVRWLERVGRQYINTGVKNSSKISFEVDVRNAQIGADGVFGVRGGANHNSEYSIIFDSDGNVKLWRAQVVASNPVYTGPIVAGNDYVFYVNGLTKNAYINGSWVFTYGNREFEAIVADNKFFIFAVCSLRTVDLYNDTPVRIAGVKMWDANNVLIRDFIPVVKDGIGYMFDKVEKKLYGNLGEGQFGIGPVKILPDNYKQVEYIESSGQQYINLGFPISNTMNFYIKCQCLAAGFVFGCRTGPSSNVSGFNFDSTGSLIGIRMGQTILSGNIGWEVGKIYEVKIENRNCVMNGNVISTTAYGSNYYSGNCYLFACNNNGSLSNTIYNSNRIFRFKIYNNNATILDLIPCISPNNEVGMYDLGTGTFFGNNGSGVFTAGPEL